ncbi:MAG: hypothetical protein COV36_01840 [Alphaproteobacteria bacterium CG11_big_fil_rev_8_21_14_0_20_44_7]|nr:MAG: hypothetical protein COV36_01840 [Alphaproteobacteria bacterium CG11_big_fil_rev_8_21_14_0_20_44_7]
MNMMNQIPYLDLITAPAEEPVSLAEAKVALKIDNSEDDAFIGNLIKAARVMAEEFLKRKLITQTWQLQYDNYAPSIVVLPKGPIQEIVHVKVIARDWSEEVIASENYYLNAGNENLHFEAALLGQIVQIQYITGYGAAADVPEPIRQGIIAHVINMYDNRMENKGMPPASQSLYEKFRVVKL